MPVDPATLVEPSLQLGGVSSHDKRVGPSPEYIAHLEAETRVSRAVSPELLPVEPDGGVAIHTLEVDPRYRLELRRVESELVPVPSYPKWKESVICRWCRAGRRTF